MVWTGEERMTKKVCVINEGDKKKETELEMERWSGICFDGSGPELAGRCETCIR